MSPRFSTNDRGKKIVINFKHKLFKDIFHRITTLFLQIKVVQGQIPNHLTETLRLIDVRGHHSLSFCESRECGGTDLHHTSHITECQRSPAI